VKRVETKELGAGRVAFLARKDAIKEKIESGRTSMSVYREYQKQIDISYSQFARYVNKFIKSRPINEIQGEKTNVPTEPINKPRERTTGFTLNTDTSDKRKKTII
jgi:hypothetical protein